MLTDLKPRQSDTGFKGCRGLGRPDHSCFLLFACFIIIKLGSKFNVEDVRLQESIGQIFQYYRMYPCYKYTGDLPTKLQADILIFSFLRCFTKGFQVSVLDLSLEREGSIEFRNVRSQRRESRIQSQVLIKADLASQGRFDQEGSVFRRRHPRMSAYLRIQRTHCDHSLDDLGVSNGQMR